MARSRRPVPIHSVVLLLTIILAFFVPWPWNLLVLFGGVLLEIGEVIWGLRLARRWRPKTGREAMIGMRAEVVSPCRPNGTVRVHGELWEATCTAGADVGDSVTIARLEGLNLIVVPAERNRSTPPPGGTIIPSRRCSAATAPVSCVQRHSVHPASRCAASAGRRFGV
jgi:membrane protein implicated in regulation of membrane protease activity